jgi:hypothetical protein
MLRSPTANALRRPPPRRRESGLRPARTTYYSVGVAGFRLNPALAAYLHRNESTTVRSSGDLVVPNARPIVTMAKQRRARTRLSDADIADIVESFKRGTAKHVLATRYGIGLTTVKKQLREHGVKGHPGTWSRDRTQTGWPISTSGARALQRGLRSVVTKN